MVLHIYTSLRPLPITKLENTLATGMNAPPTQSTCISRAAGNHLSVMAMTMNSGAMSASPKSAGQERKAVKRSILRNARH